MGRAAPRSEGRGVQIAVVNTVREAARSVAGGNGGAVGQVGAEQRCAARTEKRGASGGIQNGEGQTGLEGSDAADFPSAEEQVLDSGGVGENRQIVDVADDQAVGAVKVRKTLGGITLTWLL